MGVNEALYTRLSGQVALVTGASSGLGLQFAKTLAREGVKVAAAARRRDKLDSLVEEITETGGTAMAVSPTWRTRRASPARWTRSRRGWGG